MLKKIFGSPGQTSKLLLLHRDNVTTHQPTSYMFLLLLLQLLFFSFTTSTTSTTSTAPTTTTTTTLPVLYSYTSLVGRSVSTSTDVQLSANSEVYLEFHSKPSLKTTVLSAELFLSSNSFNGIVSTVSNNGIQVSISLVPTTTPHETSPATTNTTTIIQLQPQVNQWYVELTPTIAPRLRPSSLDPTSEGISSMAQWSNVVLPRGMKEDGKDFLKLALAWKSSNQGSTFININTGRHPDRNRWPTLTVHSSSERWSTVEPTVVPNNVATDLTVIGTFEPETWYSCTFASLLNSTTTTELEGIHYRGPYTQARSTNELHCESPPVNDTAKQCATFDTVDTWGRCYETVRLVVIRRWRHPQESNDREVILAYTGLAGNSAVVIATPTPLLRENNHQGMYESQAPFFDGASTSTQGSTYHGAALEEAENPTNRGSVF